MPETTREQTRTWAADPEERRPDQDMSTRTMLTLGGIMTAGVAAVLAMVTLMGHLSGDSGPETPARPAAATQQDGAPVETVAPAAPAGKAPVRRVAITPHVAVPPTEGLDQQTARVRLRATRLIVANILRVPSALPAGQVVRSFPAAGTGLPIGGRVTLYVSNGVPAADQVTVPYLRGLSLAQARAAAAKYGLRVVVTNGNGSVRTQTPVPGSMTPRGAEIAVVLHA
jgi:hypothetical protein